MLNAGSQMSEAGSQKSEFRRALNLQQFLTSNFGLLTSSLQAIYDNNASPAFELSPVSKQLLV